MSADTGKTVFISYVREDEKYARRLYANLKSSGMEPWMDKEDLLCGEYFRPKILETIADCQFFIAVLSKSSVNKPGMFQRELYEAIERNKYRPKTSVYFMPILIEDVPYGSLMIEIQAMHYIRMYPSWEDGFMKILKAMKYNNKQVLIDQPMVNFFPSSYNFANAAVEDLAWIAKLESETYNNEDAIHEDKLREWYEANPRGFFILLHDDTRIGHLDMLPIIKGDALFNDFRMGITCEKSITGDSIVPPAKQAETEILYIESVIIDSSKTSDPKGITPILYLLSRIYLLSSAVANYNNLKWVYAIAATNAGRRLLEMLGFGIETPGHIRKDKHDLYKAPFSVLVNNILDIPIDAKLKYVMRMGL